MNEVLDATKPDGKFRFRVSVNGVQLGMSRVVIKGRHLMMEFALSGISFPRDKHKEMIKALKSGEQALIRVDTYDAKGKVNDRWWMKCKFDRETRWQKGVIGMVKLLCLIKQFQDLNRMR